MTNKLPITSWPQSLKRFLTDILLPPTCSGCGVAVSSHGVLCTDCWTSLDFITPPLCPIMGIPLCYDAGEGFISGEAFNTPPPFRRARSVLIHDGLARKLVTRLKYGERTDLAATMANLMITAGRELIDEADIIIPVPLHHWRFFKRRYNQSAELARHIAHKTQKSFHAGLLQRRKRTRQQTRLNAREREDNVRAAFHVEKHNRPHIEGQHILLIDDVYTTGATVKSASRALLRAKAQTVDILTFSRVWQKP